MKRGSWHNVPQSLLTVSLNLCEDKDSPLPMQAGRWCEECHVRLQRLSAVTDTLTRSRCTNARFGVSEYSLGNCENLQRTSVHRLTLKILRTKQSGLEWDHGIASHIQQNGKLFAGDSIARQDHDTTSLQQQHTGQFGARMLIPNPFRLQMRKVKDKMTVWKYITSWLKSLDSIQSSKEEPVPRMSLFYGPSLHL